MSRHEKAGLLKDENVHVSGDSRFRSQDTVPPPASPSFPNCPPLPIGGSPPSSIQSRDWEEREGPVEPPAQAPRPTHPNPCHRGNRPPPEAGQRETEQKTRLQAQPQSPLGMGGSDQGQRIRRERPRPGRRGKPRAEGGAAGKLDLAPWTNTWRPN